MNLSVDCFLELAEKDTGLSDWGSDHFRTALAILIESVENEVELTETGQVSLEANVRQLLGTRLRILDDRKRYPGIAEEQIAPPFVVTGLPRTGTTLLHALLAQDPANRAPLYWEVSRPSPPPEQATRETDPRIELAKKDIEMWYALSPELAAVHPFDAYLPEECGSFFQLEFRTIVFLAWYRATRYAAWLAQADFRPSYTMHQYMLQHLQWRCPGDRWVLKAPEHLFHFDLLLETYPDAMVVHTHRDPVRVMPSMASLITKFRSRSIQRVDRADVAAHWVEMFEHGLSLVLAIRDRLGDGPNFYDVHYLDLLHDPFATVRRVYEHFGLLLRPEAEARMRGWLAANPQDKHGLHHYTLDEYGLDADEIEQRFEGYCARFGVTRE